MPSLPAIPLSWIYSIVLSVLTGALVFFGGLYYFDLDRKTESYDDDLRETIEEDPSFSGIQQAAYPRLISTSDSRISKATTKVKQYSRTLSDKPDKIVVLDGQNMEQRRIEMVRQRVQDVPGRSLLTKELVGAIRAHYALQLALSQEDVRTGVVEHFRSNLENYDYSDKVQKLADPENLDNLTLLDGHYSDTKQDALNDVFLRLVQAAERYCVDINSDPQKKKDEMNRCQRVLMVTFFGLWAERTLGITVTPDLHSENCGTAYRHDIRDEDNWGYWMIPETECGETEFKRLRHLAWKIEGFIEEHWNDDPYLKLHPKGDSIKEMEQVPMPFAIFHKEEEVFRGGAQSGNG